MGLVCECVYVFMCVCAWQCNEQRNGLTLRKTSVSLVPIQLLGPLPNEHRKCSWPAFLHMQKHSYMVTHKCKMCAKKPEMQKSVYGRNFNSWRNTKLFFKWFSSNQSANACIVQQDWIWISFSQALSRIMTTLCVCCVCLTNQSKKALLSAGWPSGLTSYDGNMMGRCHVFQPMIGPEWWPVVTDDHKLTLSICHLEMNADVNACECKSGTVGIENVCLNTNNGALFRIFKCFTCNLKYSAILSVSVHFFIGVFASYAGRNVWHAWYKQNRDRNCSIVFLVVKNSELEMHLWTPPRLLACSSWPLWHESQWNNTYCNISLWGIKRKSCRLWTERLNCVKVTT